MVNTQYIGANSIMHSSTFWLLVQITNDNCLLIKSINSMAYD